MVLPLTDPRVAVIVVWPGATPVERPLVAIVATVDAEELQLTAFVTSCWLPSLKLPVAVNCWVAPATKLRFAGLTAMDDRVAEVTVKVEDPATEPAVAVIVVCPALAELATPLVAMVATVGAELAQLTDVVRSCRLPFVNLPVALNGCTVPTAQRGF